MVIEPALAATPNQGRASSCHLPRGDFTESCHNVEVKPYVSSDSNVPRACQLIAECATEFSGLPPVRNSIFYAANTELQDVSNRNGTLTQGGQHLSRSTAKKSSKTVKSTTCKVPKGSFRETCEVTPNRYESTDPNLETADLCQAQAECKALDRTVSSNMVYFNHQEANSATNRIENCDGLLVSHFTDQRCQESSRKTREIAREEGQRQLKL